jgi:hypothetical protein
MERILISNDFAGESVLFLLHQLIYVGCAEFNEPTRSVAYGTKKTVCAENAKNGECKAVGARRRVVNSY